MKKQVIYIIVVVVLLIIIVLFVVQMNGSFKQDEIDQKKQQKIDHLFLTLMQVAGPADKAGLIERETAIKSELAENLTEEEIVFLDEYTQNIVVLKNERSPVSPVSIAMIGYLGQNFQQMKSIIEKTSLKNFMDKLRIKSST